MNNSETLFNFLNQKLPNTVNYDELSNLCYALFCTLDILPENLRTLKVSKEILAETFAKLTREKKVFSVPSEDIHIQIHWINQINTAMINNDWPDIEKAGITLKSNLSN